MSRSLEDHPRYTPTTCFEPLQLPWPPGAEPADDLRRAAIASAAKTWDERHVAELKKRTLTDLYNARPGWLAHAHAALDRAVWAAYGWDDPDPATVPEETIL